MIILSDIDIKDNEVLFKKPYIFSKNNIYAGLLIKCDKPSFKVEDRFGNRYGDKKIKEMGIDNKKSTSGKGVRKILFAIDNEGVANDLLYYSSNYEIEGLNPKRETDRKHIITNIVSLRDILSKLNFGENLTEKDIKLIYNIFLRNDNEFNLNLAMNGLLFSSNGRMKSTINNDEEIMQKLKLLAELRKYSKKPIDLGNEEKYTKERIKTLF